MVNPLPCCVLVVVALLEGVPVPHVNRNANAEVIVIPQHGPATAGEPDNDRLRQIMERSYVDVLGVAEDRKVTMRTGATILGVTRVAEAHVTRGLYP